MRSILNFKITHYIACMILLKFFMMIRGTCFMVQRTWHGWLEKEFGSKFLKLKILKY